MGIFIYILKVLSLLMPKLDQKSSINYKLKLVVQSGKFKIGYKNVIKTMRQGQAKLILISNNTPAIRRTELEYYAVLAKCDVHHYEGNNIELGTSMGKLFSVSAAVISEPGDSDILEGI